MTERKRNVAHEDGTHIDHPRLDATVRRRVIFIGGVLPILIALIATALMLSWLPELPDPIATHWGGSGPNGFGSAFTLLFLPLGITVLFCLFSIGAALNGSHRTGLAWTQKFLLVMGIWLSTLLSVGIAGSLATQRGLEHARNAPDPALPLIIGAVGGIILAFAAWFQLPKTDTTEERGVEHKAVSLSGSEHISWSRTTTISPVLLAILGLVVALSAGATVLALLSASEGLWVPAAVLALVVVLVASTTHWRVTADRRGLTVRGILGWPSIRIPFERISSVRVVDVNPAADFGGWGYRWAGHGRSGIIMRAGQAIEVARDNGRRFVVTVDDAATGAGVLTALLAHRAH